MKENYIQLRCHIPFSCKYIFVDTADHMYQRVMEKAKVKTIGVKECIKVGSPFRLISCYIMKRDRNAFCEAIEQIRNNALLLGYKEYDNMCSYLQKVLEE